MKNTPAVFLTALAVSAISLTVPMPAASTVLNLFIGEDITAQNTTPTSCKNRQHTTIEADKEQPENEPANAHDLESIELMQKLS